MLSTQSKINNFYLSEPNRLNYFKWEDISPPPLGTVALRRYSTHHKILYLPIYLYVILHKPFFFLNKIKDIIISRSSIRFENEYS